MAAPELRIGSLFSGIGGLELGLEWAGLGPVAWQVESDARCRLVLAKHWPAADRSVEDVRDAGSASLWPVDIVAGGFPCQDVSAAGRGAGLDGARSGLWWEFRRVVDELGPLVVVVVENVASGARRWLCAVRSSLHELGYRTRALGVGACDVGAPHLRRRVFVVAYADRYRQLEPGGYAQRGGRALNGGQLAHPWEPPRTLAGVRDRPARLKALGNAVVPQCAYVVGLAIRADLEAWYASA